MKLKSLIIGLMLTSLLSCAHEVSLYSTKDITQAEYNEIKAAAEATKRLPANVGDNCLGLVGRLFGSKSKGAALPELPALKSEKLYFPNGKEYILYRANLNAMKDNDYDNFLNQTAEILFESIEPFGHIRLRLGKKVYSFSNIQFATINEFSPRIFNKSSKEDMPSAQGFIFKIDKAKLENLQDEIDLFYKSSNSQNMPPFDAYSALIKVQEKPNGQVQYTSPSPKYANNGMAKATIVEEGGRYFLKASNDYKMPLIKRSNEYFIQSYSCATSAAHILREHFGISVSYSSGAKSIAQSLLNGNINEQVSPFAIMRYYEE
jgi:hypothetical protein